jgi:hypothetical protein
MRPKRAPKGPKTTPKSPLGSAGWQGRTAKTRNIKHFCGGGISWTAVTGRSGKRTNVLDPARDRRWTGGRTPSTPRTMRCGVDVEGSRLLNNPPALTKPPRRPRRAPSPWDRWPAGKIEAGSGTHGPSLLCNPILPPRRWPWQMEHAALPGHHPTIYHRLADPSISARRDDSCPTRPTDLRSPPRKP